MWKRHKPEEIIAKLRQVEVMTGQGTMMADAIRSIGVTEVTYYRWRSEHGGMKLDQVKTAPMSEATSGRRTRAPIALTDASGLIGRMTAAASSLSGSATVAR